MKPSQWASTSAARRSKRWSPTRTATSKRGCGSRINCGCRPRPARARCRRGMAAGPLAALDRLALPLRKRWPFRRWCPR
ncbi:putative d-xylulose kinase xylB [Mycobacterium kansasii]|uniref:Putative d-xylulose kinase xylB n=1 Tax=Mycobacterium kansasii TaxID=1768 RepID=A0A1V3XWL0_MYCKA|nr:putative d-xylulose kinase xylB [Mycobacterium kansasii]